MRIQEYVPLKNLTTLKVGGVARYLTLISSLRELRQALAFAREKNLPFVILGGGSNVLVADEGCAGLVIKNEIQGIEWSEAPPSATTLRKGEEEGSVRVIAGAGESWDALVAASVEQGLWGVENLSGIPGTAGAAPVQNIGAYGTELADVLEWVETLDSETGEVRTLTKDACGLSYRESFFKTPKGKSCIITRVALRLTKNGTPNLEYKDLALKFQVPSSKFQVEAPALAGIREAVLEIRAGKFPDLAKFGTAGSFFKNPIISQAQFDELKKRFPALPGFKLRIKDEGLRMKISLAWVLDNICDLKGYQKGNVKLFEKQPIVLVQTGDATSEEVESFAREVILRVKEKTGIDVEWEVQKIS
jgi:UDP-N-acetylmuramate dehydrogenase